MNEKELKRYLKKRIKSLRPDQKEVFDKMQTTNLHQFCYPCGFGKGYIMHTDIIYSIINRIINKGQPRIHALLSHRLALNEQHISDLFRDLKPLFPNVAFVFIGSEGGLNNDDLEDKELNNSLLKLNIELSGQNKKLLSSPKELKIETTKSNELINFIRSNIDKDIVVVSTYHSCDLLGHPEIFVDTLHCDEAHELASDFNTAMKKDSHLNNVLSIKLRRKFSSTATPKDCSEDPSNTSFMNNFKLFGKRSEMPHIEAVEKGYIVSSTVEILYPNNYSPNFNVDFGTIENKAYMCYRGFERNKEWLKKVSAFPDLIKSKLMVRCASVEKDMWPIFNELKKYAPTDVYLFACASEDSNGNKIKENCIYRNGVCLSYDKQNGFKPLKGKLSRKNYIKALQSLKDTDCAIILHHDTISEGINVPTFTGFLPLSDTLLNFIKLYQNWGRVLRLHPLDKVKLNRGEISVFGEGWIKPEAQIIIPYWSNVSEKATDSMIELIIDLETNLGAKLATEMPYGSDMATGYGENPEVSNRIRVDNRKEITPDLIFSVRYNREVEKRRRMELNLLLDKMSLKEQMEYLYNI
jgi:hypothetical protein